MLTDSYYSATVPEPRVILGVRLRPLSLGHVVLMNRVESAFVCGGPVRYEDLAISVMICALTYEEGCKALEDSGLPNAMKKWAERLTRTRWIDRALRRKPTPIAFGQKCDEFRDYLIKGSWHPNYKTNTDARSNDINLPSEQVVRVLLMREMGFSEAELMNRSWSLCLTDAYTIRALDGQIGIMPDDDELAEFVKQAEAVIQKIQADNGDRN